MPISLTSNKPLVSFGGKRKIDFPIFSHIVMSSDINVAPESISLKAKSDLPKPDFPVIITPASSMTTEVEWTLFVFILNHFKKFDLSFLFKTITLVLSSFPFFKTTCKSNESPSFNFLVISPVQEIAHVCRGYHI